MRGHSEFAADSEFAGSCSPSALVAEGETVGQRGPRRRTHPPKPLGLSKGLTPENPSRSDGYPTNIRRSKWPNPTGFRRAITGYPVRRAAIRLLATCFQRTSCTVTRANARVNTNRCFVINDYVLKKLNLTRPEAMLAARKNAS